MTTAIPIVTDGVLQSFASLSIASDAGKYIDENGVMQSASANTARRQYNSTVGKHGLLVEKARENLCLWSEDVSNAAWVASNVTKGSTSTNDPEGNANTTCELTASDANGTVLQTVTSAVNEHGYGVWLKRKTGTGNIYITPNGGTYWQACEVTSEWQKFDVGYWVDILDPQVGIKIETSGDSVFFWGSVLETGYDEAGSYIKTEGVSASRVGDVIKITDAVTDIGLNGTGYGVYSKHSWYRNIQSGMANCPWSVNLSGTMERVYPRRNGLNDFDIVCTSSWGTVAILAIDADENFVVNAAYRSAVGIEANNFRSAFESETPATDTAGACPSPTIFEIGCNLGINQLDGEIFDLDFFATRPTDEELDNLASIGALYPNINTLLATNRRRRR